jgi:hypothetical protein
MTVLIAVNEIEETKLRKENYWKSSHPKNQAVFRFRGSGILSQCRSGSRLLMTKNLKTFTAEKNVLFF